MLNEKSIFRSLIRCTFIAKNVNLLTIEGERDVYRSTQTNVIIIKQSRF